MTLRQVLLSASLLFGACGLLPRPAQGQTDWYGYGIMRQQTINGINAQNKRDAFKRMHKSKSRKAKHSWHSKESKKQKSVHGKKTSYRRR